MSLFSIETAPVPLDAETYLGEKREYTQIIPETELIVLTENNCTIPVPVTVLCLSAIFVCNINSSELHSQSVALRSQYSDHVPEAVTLH